MGRYDDDDSEYVAYGNMSGGYVKQEIQVRQFEEKYVPEFSIAEDILENMSTDEIENLASLLNKIKQQDFTEDDKQKMVSLGAPDVLAKPDILEDFTDGFYVEKNKFSLHVLVAQKFYEKMMLVACQDNTKSLYFRLLMMTKYKRCQNLDPMQYSDKARRLMFMKTYAKTFPEERILYCLFGKRGDLYTRYSQHDVNMALEGIKPEEFCEILSNPYNDLEITNLYEYSEASVEDADKFIPYVVEVLKNPSFPIGLKERYISSVTKWIFTNEGKAEIKNKDYFFAVCDELLPQRARQLEASTDNERVWYARAVESKEWYIDKCIGRIVNRINKTDKVTENQKSFLDQYLKNYFKNDNWNNFGYDTRLAPKYLEIASEENRIFYLERLRCSDYESRREPYKEQFLKSGVSMCGALDFCSYINEPDELEKCIREGFFIRTSEGKVANYINLCHSIYDACTEPLDDEKKSKIREVGEGLLQKLTKEYPLEEKEIDKLDNKSLLVLTYTGDVKGREIKIESGKNKIDQKLLQAGLLKLSARTQVDRSPVSKYCDINEIWVDEGFFGCKTNLLDAKLRRGAINDVIDLINRGANVSVKVERSNRDNQKFPISPFDRYISGILYRGKWHVIEQLGEDMQKIAREVNLDKLFAVNKIFGSLSYKTRNDERVRYIEKQVNQIISERNPKLLGKDGKSR